MGKNDEIKISWNLSQIICFIYSYSKLKCNKRKEESRTKTEKIIESKYKKLEFNENWNPLRRKTRNSWKNCFHIFVESFSRRGVIFWCFRSVSLMWLFTNSFSAHFSDPTFLSAKVFQSKRCSCKMLLK